MLCGADLFCGADLYGRPDQYTIIFERYFKVKTSRVLLTAIAALACIAPAAANAAPRAACGLFSLAEIRTVLAAPVVSLIEGTPPPTVRGDATFSTCTYALPKTFRDGSSFTLMWAPAAELAQTAKFYAQKKATTQMKNGVLVLATVTKTSGGTAVIDRAASKKLLAAILARL